MKIVLEDRIRVIDLPGEDVWTEEEFFNFCAANPELNLERDKEGNVLLISPVFSIGGMYESRLNGALIVWNNQSDLGYTFSSSTGFTLPNNAVRSPDAAWIAKDRWDSLSPDAKDKFAHICPDFVAEIRSKSDSLEPLQQKMKEYIANGSKLGFLIDPYDQKAWIYRVQQNEPELVTDFMQSLSGYEVLPGFSLDLNIFH